MIVDASKLDFNQKYFNVFTERVIFFILYSYAWPRKPMNKQTYCFFWIRSAQKVTQET